MDTFFKILEISEFLFAHNFGIWSTTGIITILILGATFKTFIQKKISNPPTINNNIGYYQEMYNQDIYEIMYFNFISALSICFSSTLLLIIRYDKRINSDWTTAIKYYSFSLFFLVFIAATIFLLAYFLGYKSQKRKGFVTIA